MGDLYGGIEAGGTKFVCAIGTSPDDVRAELRFQTTEPTETLHRAIEFFQGASHMEEISALGVASFGPIDLRPSSPTYGYITSTPKPGWTNTNIVGLIRAGLNLPIGFDTDVNGAALGEHRWGAARGLDNFVYLTIGTGIGGGGMVNGELLHGLMHPEMGHLFIPHDLNVDPFTGACPFHHDCFEGLASGFAIEKRWGRQGGEIPADHRAWALEAHYIALAIVNLIYALSPERIVLGGGVMRQATVFGMVRENVRVLMNEYAPADQVESTLDKYIVAPALGERSGAFGALALAEKAARAE